MKPEDFKHQIIELCALRDRSHLLRLQRQYKNSNSDRGVREKLMTAIGASTSNVQSRVDNRPQPSFNQNLPFYEYREKLKKVILNHQVTIVCGETGSGKSTQLPQLCLELGLADRGKIGHTQPRRLAARTVSSRISEELGTLPGEAVGFKVRFTDTSSPHSYIKIMTDGILLAEVQNDRWLNEYQTLIIDEAHERSLNVDLLLGYIKTLLPKRPELRLLITSATIDPERFSRYFDHAPLVRVSGRGYPVETRYRPVVDEQQKDRDRIMAVIDALDELFAISPQDTLIFFPGERQIREAAEKISKRFHQYEILPLYARLNHAQQQKIFKPGGKRKIVLATNVAETSITIPGIRYVIDTGLARISRYSWRAKVQRLPIEKISQASANQRAGRCGRVAAGICIRLYDEEDFTSRLEFTDPEILRTNLASVILQMDNLRVGHIRDFDFLDPPDTRLISDGYRLLNELQAVAENDRVTARGKIISRLSIDPRLARMLIEADKNNCVKELLIITSLLSVQDPRDQSQENRQAANEKFSLWQDEQSDFLGWLNLWQEINRQKTDLSRNQFAGWCRKNYLSWLRIREWQDIHKQVLLQVRDLKIKINSKQADNELIHRSILSGIPSHVAELDQEGNYKSTRGRELTIFPSSVLTRKKPRWIMAFSLIDTSRLFAHVVAGINPQWIMADCPHLLQHEYYQPHWQEKQGRVAAYRNTRLYGLQIEGAKRVNYASINKKESREIFIRQALVEGRYQTRANFILDNRKLVDYYKEQEDRERRRDLLIGEDQLYDFYDQRVAETVVDAVSFESWVKKIKVQQIRELTLFDEDVITKEHKKDTTAFPETLSIKNQTIPLQYVFDPADEADGVTAHILLPLLNQFNDEDFEYLVPGLLEEKIQALIKSLPKQLRKNFIPVAEFAKACLQALHTKESLLVQLSDTLQRMTGVRIGLDEWREDRIDAHFYMRYCLWDNNVCRGCSRSLIELKHEYSEAATESFAHQLQHDETLSREGLTEWDFEKFPAQVSIKKDNIQVTAYPALVDYRDSVSIELFETRQDADFYHATGIARLISFQLDETIRYCEKNLPAIDRSALMYVAMGTRQDLVEDIVLTVIMECFPGKKIPVDRNEFNQCIDLNRTGFLSAANDKASAVNQILELHRDVRNRLQTSTIPSNHLDDCWQQCEYLVYESFIRDIPATFFRRIAVYFQALLKRLDKIALDSTQADRVLPLVRELWEEYLLLAEDPENELEKLEQLRWMIEEFRITCFAQPMKTQKPVSENRIRKVIESIRKK